MIGCEYYLFRLLFSNVKIEIPVSIYISSIMIGCGYYFFRLLFSDVKIEIPVLICISSIMVGWGFISEKKSPRIEAEFVTQSKTIQC